VCKPYLVSKLCLQKRTCNQPPPPLQLQPLNKKRWNKPAQVTNNCITRSSRLHSHNRVILRHPPSSKIMATTVKIIWGANNLLFRRNLLLNRLTYKQNKRTYQNAWSWQEPQSPNNKKSALALTTTPNNKVALSNPHSTKPKQPHQLWASNVNCKLIPKQTCKRQQPPNSTWWVKSHHSPQRLLNYHPS